MTLAEQRDSYKNFVRSDAGKEFLKSAEALVNANIAKAMNEADLNYLSRAKGNQEVLDLLDNVINTEARPKE